MAMTFTDTIWIATLAVVLYAGYTDWRTRRIPNWLTVSGFFLGIILNSILGGWRGALGSLEGAGLALGSCFRWCCCADSARAIGN